MNKQSPTGKTVSGNAPFGYRWHDGNLVLDETEAPIRKLMYELFLRHRRKKTVARLLNEQGYKTRNGALFSDSSVERILRDDSAKGIFQINQNGKTKEIQIEPIIPVELWEQVNVILDSERKPLKKAVNLFAGLVSCYCGGRMAVPSNSPKYVCQTCRHKIETTDLEEIFREHLKSFVLPVSENESKSLYDCWQIFAADEKRAVVEQILEQIIIGKAAIKIEFGISPDSLKTMVFGQQEEDGLAEPESEANLREATEKQKPQSEKLTEPLMNEIEAAKFLGISRMTLLRRRNGGEIGFFRVGFRVLYSKEKHLIPFLENCEQIAEKE